MDPALHILQNLLKKWGDYSQAEKNFKLVPRFRQAVEKFGAKDVFFYIDSLAYWIKQSNHEPGIVESCIKGIPLYNFISPMPKPPNVLYRGIDFKESELNKVGKAKVFKYGLKKPANSWSVKKDAAIEFGNAILIIKGGKLAQYGTVFLWPTINTEWQYILHLRTHLFEYEWAVRLEKEMPIDKIEILYGRI